MSYCRSWQYIAYSLSVFFASLYLDPDLECIGANAASVGCQPSSTASTLCSDPLPHSLQGSGPQQCPYLILLQLCGSLRLSLCTRTPSIWIMRPIKLRGEGLRGS